MDPQIAKRCIHSVQHIPCTSISNYGVKTFGTAVPRKCYAEGKIKQIRGKDGNMIISSRQLYFDTLLPITTNDEMTVDSEAVPSVLLGFSKFDGLKAGTGTTVVYL